MVPVMLLSPHIGFQYIVNRVNSGDATPALEYWGNRTSSEHFYSIQKLAEQRNIARNPETALFFLCWASFYCFSFLT